MKTAPSLSVSGKFSLNPIHGLRPGLLFHLEWRKAGWYGRDTRVVLHFIGALDMLGAQCACGHDCQSHSHVWELHRQEEHSLVGRAFMTPEVNKMPGTCHLALPATLTSHCSLAERKNRAPVETHLLSSPRSTHDLVYHQGREDANSAIEVPFPKAIINSSLLPGQHSDDGSLREAELLWALPLVVIEGPDQPG